MGRNPELRTPISGLVVEPSVRPEVCLVADQVPEVVRSIAIGFFWTAVWAIIMG